MLNLFTREISVAMHPRGLSTSTAVYKPSSNSTYKITRRVRLKGEREAWAGGGGLLEAQCGEKDSSKSEWNKSDYNKSDCNSRVLLIRITNHPTAKVVQVPIYCRSIICT